MKFIKALIKKEEDFKGEIFDDMEKPQSFPCLVIFADVAYDYTYVYLDDFHPTEEKKWPIP